MQSRRIFISKVATGLAGTLATSNVLGANQRIRVGLIGCGDRGSQILREALACPAVDCLGVADIYARRLEEVRNLAPSARTYPDYRQLLEDKSLDAVLIATPQHLHAEQFNAAMDAGKHVYQEKTLAFTVDQAKRMRAAFQHAGKRRVVQVGHQWLSTGQMVDALGFLRPELMGKITAIEGRMYRNTPHGKPQWVRPIHPDMNRENIAWESFLGDTPEQPFDADRFHNWRLYWDYSGGNVFENMCHQLAFWYKGLGLTIPRAVTMTGGVYLWKDGREVPDTMNVSLEHEEEVLFTWTSGFGNDQLRIGEDVLGTDGTITHTPQSIRYVPQKVNRKTGNEMLGSTRSDAKAHMQNFFDAIRDASVPLACPFELGFRVAIACRMAVESYRQQRTVLWDPAAEQIV